MLKIHPSIRQWVLSFLAVDLIFWLLFAWGCVVDANSCWESFSFAPIVLYPLTTFPLLAIPPLESLLGPLGVIMQTIVFVAFGVLAHMLLGTLVGWALRKTKIARFVSFAVALVVLIGGTYAVIYYNFKAEMARESGANTVPTAQEITWRDWEEYVDPQELFSFQFAPGMTVISAAEPFVHLADVAIGYTTNEARYLQPNYSQDSWFIVSSQVLEEASCYASINGEQLAFDDERAVGATTFKVASATSAGAGNRYEQTLYRTHIDGICFEIATTLHYASDYTDIDEDAMNASQAEARTMLDEMVQTFRFNL